MRTKINFTALSLVFVLALASSVQAGPISQKSFKSPDEAVTALVAALESSDLAKLREIFGTNSEDLLSSGDAVRDQKGRQAFLHLYREQHALESAGSERVLLLGEENWPFPVPLVERRGSWLFDTAAGKEELVNRRIGGNELSAIDVCGEYVRAQREYYAEDRDGDGFKEYARYFVSAPGTRDGLFWVRRSGEPASPLGPFAARMFGQGYLRDTKGNPQSKKSQPYNGYYFRMVTAQGPTAPGGSKTYFGDGGRLLGGFALIAYPVRWGVSGIMTFMVNQDGQVLEKDLGAKTEALASAMESYNPDASWRVVQGSPR